MPRIRNLSAWEESQKQLLLDGLNREEWNISKAALSLGIRRQQVYILIERFGIERKPRVRQSVNQRSNGQADKT